ncbi:MAG: hypothetical protein K1X89_31910, partial [Myxococcaceae bacterium]|nr:hypothetical protein [Myxococcaceae bacterium]
MRAAASPLVFALALSACLPELHDVEGKACDSANPCPSPLTCQAGVCRSGASGGGSGGGQGGAGGGRSGGGG